MPFSDTNNYEKGHFRRVYEYIIKPACKLADFEPIRGDDVTNSNYIVIDILRKIINSDLVICDLSNNNPNVLYELGLRQAFNKPAVLIKDKITDKIFDIQGFRYLEYDSSLRIDEVEKTISKLSDFIKNTHDNKDTEINSVVQMLGIEPATLKNKVELSEENSVILNAINNLSKKINKLEISSDLKINHVRSNINIGRSSDIKNENVDFLIGSDYFINGDFTGKYIGFNPENSTLEFSIGEEVKSIQLHSREFYLIDDIPFWLKTH